ncbi:hypothetical protein KCP69_18305 [Salmonella enterica subsp. enterica]|nr:hypothetical protein KCP69_18305 [Salmonella enterica subsp. enterica]
MRLQICERALILNGSGGRSIHFEPLSPGESSPTVAASHSGATVRGALMPDKATRCMTIWRALPEEYG